MEKIKFEVCPTRWGVGNYDEYEEKFIIWACSHTGWQFHYYKGSRGCRCGGLIVAVYHEAHDWAFADVDMVKKLTSEMTWGYGVKPPKIQYHEEKWSVHPTPKWVEQ